MTIRIQNNLANLLLLEIQENPWIVDVSRKSFICSIMEWFFLQIVHKVIRQFSDVCLFTKGGIVCLFKLLACLHSMIIQTTPKLIHSNSGNSHKVLFSYFYFRKFVSHKFRLSYGFNVSTNAIIKFGCILLKSIKFLFSSLTFKEISEISDFITRLPKFLVLNSFFELSGLFSIWKLL